MANVTHQPDPVEGQRVYELDRAHVFQSWAAQAMLNPIAVASAHGCFLWDYDGKRYFDFASEFVFTNIGHQHPRVIEAIVKQANELCTVVPPHAIAARSDAAALITDLMPDTHNKVFFTNGGADANENAIRMARIFTGRDKVLSAYRSYHGNTGGAIVATGDQRRWPNEYATGHVHFSGPFMYRSPFWSDSLEQESQRALEHLEEVIRHEGPQTIAAILLETVVGGAGVIEPPPGYLQGVRALCDKYGIIYIADEVMCGFGRTGKWFAFEHYGVLPDLVTFAKGVNSGYVPMGGIIIRNDIAAIFDNSYFPGGLTYSGHPLACASAIANIEVIRDEGVLENASEVGERVLGPGLRQLMDRHVSVGDVRGIGMFWALELVKDRETKEPFAPHHSSSPQMSAVTKAARDRGLLMYVVSNRLHVCPPCNTTADEIREALAILDQVLTVADEVL